jgi:hypothetical protein
MFVTPVNWYQVSSPLKLMMDRLVCADGGNPDPTRTHGKDAAKAKELELAGWDYPRHLAGRLFAVVVHGDVEGAENVRRSISDWLSFMQLAPAGNGAEIDRYIGYWKPYATSHDELDADQAIQEEVRNAARVLLEAIGRSDPASKSARRAPRPPAAEVNARQRARIGSQTYYRPNKRSVTSIPLHAPVIVEQSQPFQGVAVASMTPAMSGRELHHHSEGAHTVRDRVRRCGMDEPSRLPGARHHPFA